MDGNMKELSEDFFLICIRLLTIFELTVDMAATLNFYLFLSFLSTCLNFYANGGMYVYYLAISIILLTSITVVLDRYFIIDHLQ